MYYDFMMPKMSLWHQPHDVSKKGDDVYVETGIQAYVLFIMATNCSYECLLKHIA